MCSLIRVGPNKIGTSEEGRKRGVEGSPHESKKLIVNSKSSLFQAALELLKEIPTFREDEKKDRDLESWLEQHEITSNIALRAAAALVSQWDPRRYKKYRTVFHNWAQGTGLGARTAYKRRLSF